MTSRLSSLLVQDGLVSAKRMADAFQRQVIYGGTLDTNLLEMRVVEEDVLLTYLGRASGLPTQPAGLAAMGSPAAEALRLFPKELATRFRAIPCRSPEDGVLRVLVADPVEPQDMEALAQNVRQRIEPWISTEFRVMEALEGVYGEAMPARFQRLLQKSKQAHATKELPQPRLIDPVPRFGNLHEFRLEPSGPVAAGILPPSPRKSQPPPPPQPAPAPFEEEEVTQVEPRLALHSAVTPILRPQEPVPEVIPERSEPMVPIHVSGPQDVPVPLSDQPTPRERPIEVRPSAMAMGAKEAAAAAQARARQEAARTEAAWAEAARAEAERLEAERLAAERAEAARTEAAREAAERAAKAAQEATAKAAAEKAAKEAAAKEAAKAAAEKAAKEAAAKEAVERAAKEAAAKEAAEKEAAEKEAAEKEAAEKEAAAKEAAAREAAEKAAKEAAAKEAAEAEARKEAEREAAARAEAARIEATKPPKGEPSAGGKRGKRGKRQKESQRLPLPAPIVARPVTAQNKVVPAPTISPPPGKQPSAQPQAPQPLDERTIRTPPPSVALTPGPQPPAHLAPIPGPRATSEHTPLPSPMPPSSEFSEPHQSLLAPLPSQGEAPAEQASAYDVEPSDLAAAVDGEEGLPEPVPVPIDSGRLGEQIVVGRPGQKPEVKKESPRVAVALGESRPLPLSFEAAVEIIGSASERDAIFEALCRAVRSRAAFASVFTVHGDVAFGRIALADEWLDRQGLGKVAIPLDRPSAFRIAVKGRAPYQGRLGDQPAAGDALSAMGRKPPLVGAVLPVLVRARPLALLYLDDDGRALPTTLLDELKPLLSEVSHAFQRLVLRSRTGGFGLEQEGGRGDERAGWHPERDKRGTLARFSASGEVSTTKVVEVRDPPGKPREAAMAESAVPKASPESPTTRLRPDAGKRQGAVSRPDLVVSPTPKVEITDEAIRPEPPASTAAIEAKPEVKPESRPETKVEPRSEVKAETKPEARPESKTEAKAEAKTEARPESKPEAKPEVKTDAKPKLSGRHDSKVETRPKASGRIEAKAQGPSFAELIVKAGQNDAKAQAALIEGGEQAARAVVMALPGPLKSRERQALGDAIGEPLYARGPLLALVPRLGQAAVQPLLERLENPVTPPDIRYYVALCFTEMPVPSAVAPLGRRLFDSDDAVRMAAVTALRCCPAVPELQELLETLRSDLLGGEPRRQQHATEALGELRDVQAIPRLIQTLSATDLLLAGAAAKALQTITKEDFGRSKWRWKRWWTRHQGEPRLQWILAGLCHENSAVRASCQDELRGLCGDVAGYRFDLSRREREAAYKRLVAWWQQRGYGVYAP